MILEGMEAKAPVSHSDFKGDGSKDASHTKGLKGDGEKNAIFT